MTALVAEYRRVWVADLAEGSLTPFVKGKSPVSADVFVADIYFPARD